MDSARAEGGDLISGISCLSAYFDLATGKHEGKE